MSWMARLYETYDKATGDRGNPLWPLSHSIKNAHIEVVINLEGNIVLGGLKVLAGEEAATLIPATESSAGRAGAKIAPHPLCEEMSYCAFDLPDSKSEKFDAYLSQLEAWSCSEYSHPKVKAIFTYVSKKSLWHDISSVLNFPLSFKSRAGTVSKVSPEKAFIRWRVESQGDKATGTWEDQSLVKQWISFDAAYNSVDGFCFVKGDVLRVANNHPRFIRNAGDGGKLVSSNDSKGFTYRGKFIEAAQAATTSFDVTQKAHNALRWLIAKQGSRNGDQVTVAWAVSGKPIPQPIAESEWIDPNDYGDDDAPNAVASTPDQARIDHTIDLGDRYANQLNRYLAGYTGGTENSLDDDESIIIMVLDSATPGRMAISYYRDFRARDYLEAIKNWHSDFAWHQRFSQAASPGKKAWVTGRIAAPTPWNILQAAYGDVVKSNDALKKQLYERLLPCLVEGRAIPKDIVDNTVRRASQPNSSEHWEWERNLGVACALYRGFCCRQPLLKNKRNYIMELDEAYQGREYLYGRLLAIAEAIEKEALRRAGEYERMPNAIQLMQRFASQPASTWPNIHASLLPYLQRLGASFSAKRDAYSDLLEKVSAFFKSREDYNSNSPLKGEYLLGFYLQRQWLADYDYKYLDKQWSWVKKASNTSKTVATEGENA